MSTPRLRRLQSDYESVQYEFSGHPHVKAVFEQASPPEIYYITYYVPGLQLSGNSPVELREHRVVFKLGREYPQLKPQCEIKTPIFHPNFNGGVVCIGDKWTAGGETLVDLIVKVGDMIQYKVYNLKSPMDRKAAQWAQKNEHLFPVGNIDLYRKDPASSGKDDWEIEFHTPSDFSIEIHRG